MQCRKALVAFAPPLLENKFDYQETNDYRSTCPPAIVELINDGPDRVEWREARSEGKWAVSR